MTEETPKTSKEDYEFPNKQFQTLYDEDSDAPLYDIAASELYEGLRNEGFSTEAVEVFEYLEDGEVEQAEELTEDLLEEQGGQL